MKWEPPSFAEVKMDAEINGYQDDFGDVPAVQEPSPESSVANLSRRQE